MMATKGRVALRCRCGVDVWYTHGAKPGQRIYHHGEGEAVFTEDREDFERWLNTSPATDYPPVVAWTRRVHAYEGFDDAAYDAS